MAKPDVDGVLDELENTLYAKSMVEQLSDVGITEYERGKVKGKIEALNWIKAKLNPVKIKGEVHEDSRVRHDKKGSSNRIIRKSE